MGSQRVRYDWSNLARTSVLVWEIPWTEEPGGLQSMGSQRVGHNFTTKQQCFHTKLGAFTTITSSAPPPCSACTSSCYGDAGKLHSLSKMMQQVDGKQDWHPHLWSLDPCSTQRDGDGENEFTRTVQFGVVRWWQMLYWAQGMHGDERWLWTLGFKRELRSWWGWSLTKVERLKQGQQ